MTPLGLLDNDAAVERLLQLLGEQVVLSYAAFLQDPDCGDGGKCLRQPPLVRLQDGWRLAEKVEGTNGLLAQAKWQRSH